MRYLLLLLAAAASVAAWLVAAGKIHVPDGVEQVWPEIVVAAVMLAAALVAGSVAAGHRAVTRRVDRLIAELRSFRADMLPHQESPIPMSPPQQPVPVMPTILPPAAETAWPVQTQPTPGPHCHACGAPMLATTRTTGSGCAHLTVALLLFAAGMVVTIIVPILGWLIGPAIIIGALIMMLGGRTGEKVWRCGIL